jgi:arginyl-tRNA synthetase
MKNLSIIRESVYQAVKKAGFDIHKEDIHIDKTKTIEHGHFATNVALLLAGKVGKRPRDVADIIVGNLDNSLFDKVDIAGPGFVNFFMKTGFFQGECQSVIDNLDGYIHELVSDGDKKMVIDYSSPNIAKPLGVHHLLSTIIGDSIKRIYRKSDYKVVADNYLGDMGTQFGKLIYAIKNWGSIEEIEKDPINKLLELYVRFHDEAEGEEETTSLSTPDSLPEGKYVAKKTNQKLLDDARAEFKKFEEGDKENRDLWKQIVQWSLLEIMPLYERLNVEFDEMRGESFYEDKMAEVLSDGREKGVFVDGDNGAWIVMPDDPNDPPAIVRKSDGSSIYLTRDLAQTAYFESEYHPDLMVWVVDVAQSLHFRQRFHTSRKLGQTNARMEHVNFGRMQFKDGSMSTRKGNIVRLSEVLDEAEKRAYELADGKGLDLSENEIKELARIMGIGAVKYNILSQARTTNITFDWDKMLSFEGNSVPYLMYTVARAKSVIRKSGLDLRDIADFDLKITIPQETEVIMQLMMYPDSIRRARDEFKPNHIANFLYQLAQDFNTFYNGNPILKADDNIQKSRLLITASVIKIMEDGLGLLGIEVPEKM